MITDILATLLYNAASGKLKLQPKKVDVWQTAFAQLAKPTAAENLALHASALVLAFNRLSPAEAAEFLSTKGLKDQVRTFFLLVAEELMENGKLVPFPED
jgi:hypothetical protein